MKELAPIASARGVGWAQWDSVGQPEQAEWVRHCTEVSSLQHRRSRRSVRRGSASVSIVDSVRTSGDYDTEQPEAKGTTAELGPSNLQHFTQNINITSRHLPGRSNPTLLQIGRG